MRQTHVMLVLLLVLSGCQGLEKEPGEVAALTKGYLEIDNWGKRCGLGGVQVSLNDQTYLAINSVPAAFEGSPDSPVSVWMRYQIERPDSCAPSINRIKVLSIRKRE